MNVHEIIRRGNPSDKEHSIRFWNRSGSRSRNNFFHFSIIERWGILGIKYELKPETERIADECLSPVWRGRPSDNEQCRWRFVLYECSQVVIINGLF